MSWIDFWNSPSPIYVSERHKDVHYREVSESILGHIPVSDGRVLDFGCGEALFASDVAQRCRHLYLCDAASNVRAAIENRVGGVENISVLAPEELGEIAAGTLDVVVVNSVAQYLSREELSRTLDTFKPLLAPHGKIVFADIIPTNTGVVADTWALLRLAAKHRFLPHAIVGLGRTYFSPYRKLRAQFGLTAYEEKHFLGLLRQHGFDASRVYRNIGHNQSRMTFVAHSYRRHCWLGLSWPWLSEMLVLPCHAQALLRAACTL